MFMVQENTLQKERLEKIYKKVKALYGVVPPQMKFLGDIEAEYLEEFLKMAARILRHPNIEPDIFALIRLHIAFKEGYAYCKHFNTTLLLSKGYKQEVLNSVVENIENIPFEQQEKALVKFALKAIYESSSCQEEDFKKLEEMGWSQKDIFDAIEHAGSIFRNGRLLTAYSTKA